MPGGSRKFAGELLGPVLGSPAFHDESLVSPYMYLLVEASQAVADLGKADFVETCQRRLPLQAGGNF